MSGTASEKSEVSAAWFDEWREAAPTTLEALTGTTWLFGDLEGRPLSPFLVLAPEGLIGNVWHPSFECWQIIAGFLCFINRNGLPSIIFNVAQHGCTGVTALGGRAIIDGVDSIYIIKRIDHPPHPDAAVPDSGERRAKFIAQPNPDTRRPNLIVVRANEGSLHPRWFDNIDSRTRSWDLCVSWYGREPPLQSTFSEYLAHAPNQKKFKPIFDLFYEDSPLWNYDRIWMPDDDLLCSGQDLNRMFHLSRKYGLDLAQPALSQVQGCHINHPITAQQHGREVRMEPFVEIMCPLFSKRALKICLGSIKDAVSGYGLDHLWPSFLGRPSGRLGIIDAVGIVHTRPIGATYDVRAAIKEQAGLWNSYGFKYIPIPGVR